MHITLNTESETLTIGGREVEIVGGAKKKAFALLRELAEHAGEIMSNDDLLGRVWGVNKTTDRSANRSLDNAVCQIKSTITKATGDREFANKAIDVFPKLGKRAPSNLFMID